MSNRLNLNGQNGTNYINDNKGLISNNSNEAKSSHFSTNITTKNNSLSGSFLNEIIFNNPNQTNGSTNQNNIQTNLKYLIFSFLNYRMLNLIPTLY